MSDQIQESMKSYGPMVQGAVGTLLTAKGQNDSGIEAQRLANYQAEQLRRNGGQQVAQGTQAAQEEQRKSALIASRAMAVAAASGGGTLDPTVVRILQGVAAEGTLASNTQMYNANERARGMNDTADATVYSGNSARKAGKKKALSTILSGASDLANTWGNDPAPNSAGYTPLTGNEQAYSGQEFA
jgi:hypothetical protein